MERQGKLEEAYQQYEEAAKLHAAPSMVCIARMDLSGKYRVQKYFEPKLISFDIAQDIRNRR